jgi:hypothetical protein
MCVYEAAASIGGVIGTSSGVAFFEPSRIANRYASANRLSCTAISGVLWRASRRQSLARSRQYDLVSPTAISYWNTPGRKVYIGFCKWFVMD